MSDTETTATAPPMSAHARMQDAIARYVASTPAATGTREATSSPEAPVTAAAGVESDTATEQNTGDEPTLTDDPAGEAQDDGTPALPPPDSIIFVAEDGTPVTAEEARKGYLRQSEFTKKTQALAETAKVTAEREAMLAQARDLHIQGLQQVEQVLASRVPPEPDPALRYGTYEQRQEYLLADKDRNDALVRLATAHEQKIKLQQEQSEAQKRQAAEYQQMQATMLGEKLSAWKDPNTAAKEKAAIKGYAKQLEFSEDEIERVLDGRADHRLALILRDAVVGRQVREGGQKGGQAPKSAMPQPTRAEVRTAAPVSAVERDLRAARDNLGSGSRTTRLAAAAQILAGSQTQAARPR
jgi:hypothetical protein